MSVQTAEFRIKIDAAKKGDKHGLVFCRHILKGIAESQNTPDEVIVELSECALALGLEQSRRDQETN